MAENVVIKYEADTAQIKKALTDLGVQYKEVGDDAEDAAKKSSDGMKKADSSAKQLTTTMDKVATAVAAAFAVQTILNFASVMRDTAIQMETTAQRMSVVFGNAASSVSKSAKSMAADMGLTSSQFELMATKVGDVLVPLGLARRDAAKMSTEAVKLAGALSEFSAGQVTMEQAVHAMVGAFTGEREALKTLGVVISEEDVKQRLFEKGQKSLSGQALASAKAFATFELILEKSADAQTFFAENSDSLARQTAKSRARIAELKEEIAKNLTPTILTVTKVFTEWLSNLRVSDLLKYARVVAIVTSGLVAYKVAVVTATKVTALFGKTIRATPIGLIVGGITALVTALGTQNNELERAARAQEQYNKGLEQGAKNADIATAASLERIDALKKVQTELIATARADGKSELELARLKSNNSKELISLLEKETKAGSERVIALIMANKELQESDARLAEARENYNKAETNFEANKYAKSISFNEKRHARVARDLAKELGLQNAFINAKELEGLIEEELGRVTEHRNSLAEEQRQIHLENANISKEEYRTTLDTLAAMEKRLSILKDELAVADPNEEQAIADKIVALEKEIKLRKIKLGLVKADTSASTDAAKAADDAQKKAEKDAQDRIKNEQARLKTSFQLERIQILESVATTEEKNKKLLDLDIAYIEARIQLWKDLGLETIDLEEQLAQKQEDIRQKQEAKEKERTERKNQQQEQSSEQRKQKAEQDAALEEQIQLQLMQTYQDIGNTILDIGKQISEDSLGLAIVQVLLNQAIAVSEAIKGAQKAAAATGAAAPFTSPLFIAQMVGIVLSGFGQVFALVKQAESANQNNQSRPRFARGGIMIQGDGSSTGDGIPIMISPRESVINAAATRKNIDELRAINSGTFERLIDTKYIQPALAAQAHNLISIDGGFDAAPLLADSHRNRNEAKKRHKELIKALGKNNNGTNRARKKWY